ncbi:uncharacterized protein LOC135812635 [Sycon ciliatum]|uniref:uncharacterized protein LOC135812635 n=1 Tax=Sycon ciliatum TaxID=27933 RepID=UPI0031F6CAB7
MERRRKAIGVLTGFRACWLMAVCICLENQGVKGQTVILGAAGTGQSMAAFTVAFGNGQPTVNVTDYLPVCLVISGSGPFIRLEKTDGSLVLGETGAFSGVTTVQVNSTAHPILDTSYTGLYHCRTATHNSTQTYQLNIVAQQVQSGPSPTPLTLTYTGDTHTIPCVSSGNFPLNSSWNSTLTLDTQMIQTVTSTNLTNSTFTFQRNDSQIVFTESDTSGITFNVICTTSYTTNFDCMGMGSSPPRSQSVIDRCVNATQAMSTTVSVTIQATHCPELSSTTVTTLPRRTIGTSITASCMSGYGNISMPSTVICQADGTWTTLPTCQAHRTTEVYNPTAIALPTTGKYSTTSGNPNNTDQFSNGDGGIGTGVIILIGGIGGLLVAALIVAVLVLIIRPEKPSQPAETMPNLTENAAYGDAGFAESVLTKSDAYGVVQPAEDPHYSYVDVHQ